MTQTRKRPHEAGADLRWRAGDRDEKYSETEQGARPVLSLVYVRPPWRDQLWLPKRPKPKPKVSWRGNVAHVRIRPLGFRLIEAEPGRWYIASWQGRAHQTISTLGTREQVDAALAQLVAEVGRPVYPPLSLVRRNHVAAALGGARHG